MALKKSEGATHVSSCAVIMSVHTNDNPAYLDAALASIRNQTYQDFVTYIFIDGFLDEAINRVILNYPEVLIFKGGNQSRGLAYGLNQLIEKVLLNESIKYVFRMDSDDICHPGRFLAQVEFMNSHQDIDVSGTYCIEFDLDPSKPQFYKKLPSLHGEIYYSTLYRSPFIHPSVVFRISIFKRGFRYNDQYRLMQDYDLWTRLLIDGYKFANLNQYLLYFRVPVGFYKKRFGLIRGFRECSMRYKYARAIGMFSFKYAIFLFLFMLLRISPHFIVKIVYKYFRR